MDNKEHISDDIEMEERRHAVGVFIDNSGSTGNVASYHQRVLAILR